MEAQLAYVEIPGEAEDIARRVTVTAEDMAAVLIADRKYTEGLTFLGPLHDPSPC